MNIVDEQIVYKVHKVTGERVLLYKAITSYNTDAWIKIAEQHKNMQKL